MKALFLFISFSVISCSLLPKKKPKEGKTLYSYSDVSGTFQFIREKKLIKNKIVTRSQLITATGSNAKPLEKSIVVSEIGTVKDKNQRVPSIRPLASEFTVWLEGKKYFSKMNLDLKNKSLKVRLDSPEPRWQGVKSYPFPKGKIFCFYSQLAECLYHTNLLEKSLKREGQTFAFHVVWDNFPFLQDQFPGVGKNVFTSAVVKFDGRHKNLNRFSIELDGQTLLYHFSKSHDLVKISWIAQGITVVPLGEEISSIDE